MTGPSARGSDGGDSCSTALGRMVSVLPQTAAEGAQDRGCQILERRALTCLDEDVSPHAGKHGDRLLLNR